MKKSLLKPSALIFLDTVGSSYELEIIMLTQSDKYNTWAIQITLAETKERLFVASTTGEIKKFKDINTALELIKKYSKKLVNIRLKVILEKGNSKNESH